MFNNYLEHLSVQGFYRVFLSWVYVRDFHFDFRARVGPVFTGLVNRIELWGLGAAGYEVLGQGWVVTFLTASEEDNWVSNWVKRVFFALVMLVRYYTPNRVYSAIHVLDV